MANENVIQATFDGFYKIHTKPSWLIDHGMELSISGIDLPDEFECHFSNSRSVAAKRQIGENGVVTIPDEYFLSNAAQIFCWIYLHPTVDSGVTEYEIVIPLLTRPNVDPAEPTQEQQDIVDQAIAALNVAMAETSADAESASASATAAQAAVDSVLNMTVSADTLPSGSDASVTKSVVDDAVHLAFGIPQGAQGVQGEQGVQGPTGATPNFTIGTVQTLLPTQDATATITGTAEAPVLNLGIPKGYSGDATNLAADYSSNKIYAVGEYCIYNGSLYRCTTAITTAEAWTAAHWTAVNLGADVSNLKSAVKDITGNERIEYTVDNAYYNTSTVGATVTSTTASNNFQAAMISCSPGDAFTISGTGGPSGRLWAFLDSEHKVTRRETRTVAIQGEVITAGTGEVYLVINNHKVNDPGAVSYYGRILDKRVNDLEQGVESNTSDITTLSSDVTAIQTTGVFGSGKWLNSGSPTIDDADNATPNSIHAIPINNSVANIPSGVLGNLITLAYGKNAAIDLTQILADKNGKGLYYRALWNQDIGWTDWEKVGGYYYVVQPGGFGDFTKLTDAITEAVKHENATVYVAKGLYDIINELTSEYMESHEFDATDRGPELKNGIHLIFEQGGKVRCKYSGSNATVNKFFSPFNVSGSCFVENLNLESSNVRYAIHAENGGNSTPYREHWKGCTIVHDNHNNPNWHSMQCIGGGLGKNADILIEDCIFDPRNINSAARTDGVVTYHNNYAAESVSRVVIRDCYFADSTFSIRWYGNSTGDAYMTDAICTNCSMRSQPYARAETESSPYENVRLFAWNNVIREE